MSAIDSELILLKARLAVLEEQKRIEDEKEAEKKVNPMKILWAIIEEKKQRQNLLASATRGGHARPSPSAGVHMSSEDQVWVFDQNDKVEFLEPIFNMLKKIEERLDTTIDKQYYNQDIWSEPEPKSNVVDEIHKDLYMKLSKQEEEIAALTKLCQTFKEQAVESSSLNGVTSSEVIALKAEIETLRQAITSAAAIAVEKQEEMKRLIAEDKEWEDGWEQVERLINARIVPFERRFNQIKEEIHPVTSVKMDMGLLGLEGRAEMAGIKAEMVKMKRDITKQLLDVKSEMSSLLTGDFYIHAGGSPHGKISTKSGGTGGYCSLLSQDHLINVFTGYDVAADGTVKVNCPGRDNSYPLKQRWSFERATDKLINHPDGSARLMSIPLKPLNTITLL
jgi:hypothetical protein